MEYIVAGILAFAAFLYVAYPMVTRHRYLLDLENVFDFGDARQRRYLESKKASVFDNIKELDFEYEMGKLSDEDYARLRQAYLTEAQETLRAIDNLKIREEIEELIESEVRSRRRIP